jgi:hypothetical protein
MSMLSEQSREKALKKVQRLTRGSTGKVDASDYREPLGEMGEVKTGLRPLSRRQFKNGGKVHGSKEFRADRKPRAKGGGIVDDYYNVDMKKANEYRDGEKHFGGMKKGGRTAKLAGGALGMRPDVMPPTPVSRAPAGIRPQTGIRPTMGMRPMMRASGGRTSDWEYRDPQSSFEEAIKSGRLSGKESDANYAGHYMYMGHNGEGKATFKHASTREYLKAKGGAVHKDEAEDKKLIKSELHKAGCSCAKCSGGKVEKKRGGSIEKLEGLRATGDRIPRKSGGRTKKGNMNVNIIIAPAKPPMPPVMGARPPMPPGAGPVGMHQGAPPPMAAPAAPQPMQPPPMMRKRGGRTNYPIKSGGGGGLGRLEKIAAYG